MQKDSCSVSMILAAISGAVLYNDKKRQIKLINAAMDWAEADDNEYEREAWKKIQIAAGWIGGYSDE